MELFITILTLTGVFYTEALFQHKDIQIGGCSDTDNADEFATELDDDEVMYVDFKERKPISKLPPFADPGSWPGVYEGAQGEMVLCKSNLDVAKQAYKNPPEAKDPPQSTIYPRDEVRLGSVNTLICHVTGFFPPPVRVIWTKNDNNVTEGVSLSRFYPNNDRTYNQFSTLRFTPEEGDIYSCTVQHQALPQPQTREWEPEVSEPSVGPSVFCGVGLALGMLGVAAGTFFLVKGNNCN